MLETFNFRIVFEYLPLFFKCFGATLWLSGVSMLGALLVGILACSMRLSPRRLISKAAAVYVESIRSTPLLAQLYLLYFGLPTLGITINEELTGIIALVLNSGAYVAEIIRAGILSVPRGQVEAAEASGLSYVQRMRYVVLPQAIGATIPPLLGQSIVLVKDSSLLSLISIVELTRAGQILTSERFTPAEGFLTTAVFYLVIYYALKNLSKWSQKKLIFREAY